ncbi:MAG: hypothetical protein IPH33_15290 [Bacteroidetes bacterium]|nr:hypothetical protein [Bacteroidota bacterium]
MNTLIRIITIGALLISLAAQSQAQIVPDNKIYRVTGYKKGDAHIRVHQTMRRVIPPLKYCLLLSLQTETD